MSAIVWSETGSDVAWGVLTTRMPLAVASVTGILSVPLPVRMMALQRGKSASSSGLTSLLPPQT